MYVVPKKLKTEALQYHDSSVRLCFSLQIFNCIGEKQQKTVDGKSLKKTTWNYMHEQFTVNEEIAFNTERNLTRNTFLRQYFFK